MRKFKTTETTNAPADSVWPWYTPTPEYVAWAIANKYDNNQPGGYVLSTEEYFVNSDGTRTRIITVTWTDEEQMTIFEASPERLATRTARAAYNAENGITRVIEEIFE
jgi:hypothetical protein